MILFFISAALLVIISLAWLLLGLYSSNESSADQEAVNITLARERLATLDAALADGSIEQATYDYEREQLDYDLAADLRLEKQTRIRSGGHLSAGILVAVFVPIAAGALYLNIGDPAALTRSSATADIATAQNATQGATQNTTQGATGQGATEGGAAQTPASIAELLPQMEERLNEQPDDIEGWRLLGRSYLSVGEFEKAINAYNRALALDGADVATLAQLAESLAMTREGQLAGEPLEYVNRALAIDADNEHALWLQSIAFQQAGDHESALRGFDRLNGMAAGNAEALATIEQMRSVSVAAVGGDSGAGTGAGTDGDTAPGADTGTADQASAADESARTDAPDNATINATIEVTVDMSDDARSAASDDQTVFIFATATEGPPMPLAVSRVQVADLPVTVILDDSMAMLPNMTLSAFDSVNVGARISATGNAIAEPGDWFSEVPDINPADAGALSLTIDQQQP